MCFGFLGLQFAFGLQNANVGRIFRRERGHLLCVFNLGDTPQTLSPPPGTWRVLEAVGGATTWMLPQWSGLVATHVNASPAG